MNGPSCLLLLVIASACASLGHTGKGQSRFDMSAKHLALPPEMFQLDQLGQDDDVSSYVSSYPRVSLIDRLLSTRSKECQATFAYCSSLPTPAKTLMEQGRYCEALNDMIAKLCLVIAGNCTEADYNYAVTAVCITTTANVALPQTTQASIPQPTHISLIDRLISTRTKECQATFAYCSSLPTPAKTLMEQGKYCEAIYDLVTKLCLVTAGNCTEDDFTFIVGGVCPTSSVKTATTTRSPSHDVGITANPHSIHNGYTKRLSVNCTFNHGPSSDFSTIMSLILSKSSSPSTDDFSEVASLTAFSGDSVDIGDSMGATVKGHLEAKSLSFISLEWTYPSGQVEGKYKCEAFGMDTHGHPRTSTDITIVQEKNVDLDLALSKMKEMDKILDNLVAFQLGMTSRVQDSRDAMMEASTKFSGHTYFLSRPIVRNNAVFSSMCQLFGGYLVELNNVQEFNNMANFLKAKASDEVIALGAKDEDKDGVWTLQNSGDRMTFLDWMSGQPSSSSDKQCLYMASNATNHGMMADNCVGSEFNRFICEMNQ